MSLSNNINNNINNGTNPLSSSGIIPLNPKNLKQICKNIRSSFNEAFDVQYHSQAINIRECLQSKWSISSYKIVIPFQITLQNNNEDNNINNNNSNGNINTNHHNHQNNNSNSITENKNNCNNNTNNNNGYTNTNKYNLQSNTPITITDNDNNNNNNNHLLQKKIAVVIMVIINILWIGIAVSSKRIRLIILNLVYFIYFFCLNIINRRLKKQ